MMHKFSILMPLLLGGLVSSGNVFAASWNENSNGDLSNNGLSPSILNLNIGTNSVIGNFGAGDLDYISVIVPFGTQLTALQYGEGNIIGGVRSFIGVQAGNVMTVLPTATSAEGLLGWAHYQEATVGTNFLPDIGQGYGATGFTGPLSAGAYTFWIQDTSNQSGLKFSWDFVLSATPVPEQETYALLLAGLGVIATTARRSYTTNQT
jgi:hypothetical protein